jgi:ribonuclease P protein component
VRSRVGAIVPRHGRSAVARNRLKRRLREILRIDVLPRMTVLHVPTDVMVRARREAYEASFAELRDELNVWLDRRWLRGSSSS